jgi:hypothetical protein
MDAPQGGIQSIARSMTGFDCIQHLAIPLPSRGLNLRNEWKRCLALFQDLKTLTFLVGGNDQNWLGEGEIELRDVEEWFVDGRARTVSVEGWSLDIGEVSQFLGGRCFEERMRGAWDSEWMGVNVRCVAWKKGI